MKSVLKHLREENNLVQVTFARRAGTSQGYVSDVENGRRAMTPAFATKAAAVLGVDAVTLLSAHEFEKIVRKAEEGDPAAPHEALALAKRLLELVEEPGALNEEQAAQIQEIVGQLIRVMEGKPVEAPRAVLDKPLVPAAAKASPDVMSTLRRLGARRDEVINEDAAYERLIDSGISAAALEGLLDEISVMMSHSRLPALERRNLKAIEGAIERRIAELAGDGARSSEQVLAGDRAAMKARASEESRERRLQSECYEELGLDSRGRPIPDAKKSHDAALKNAGFLSQTERETGVDRRGLPLDERRLKSRRYAETGE